MADINITPMVDVMLVLLIIFIMAAPLLTHSVKVDLPNEKTQNTQINDAPVVVTVDAHGQYFIDNHPVNDTNLLGELSALAAKNPQQPIHIRADQTVPYAKVAHLLTVTQTAGLSKVSFVTQRDSGTSK